jgi:uncharacterized membrane protein HdeD (DUF308 family)
VERASDDIGRVTDYLTEELGLPREQARARAGALVGMMNAPRNATEWVRSHWWTFALRGVLAIVFGILFFVAPGPALAALVFLFGFWAFVDGSVAFVSAISSRHSWQLALAGVIGIAVGILTFFRPGVTALGLYFVVAVWSLARGVLEIAMAGRLRFRTGVSGWLVAGGITSLLFGVLMIILPEAGALALAWLIGLYGLIIGIALISLAVRVRSIGRRAEQPRVPVRGPELQPT